MTPENRNLILAVTLSMAVLFGWQLMVIQPEMEKEQAQQALLAEQQNVKKSLDNLQDVGTPKVVGSNGVQATPGAGGQNDLSTDNAKRITIDAPLVQGSFSLQGARIDDIVLTGYRETLDTASANISFLQKPVLSRHFLSNLDGPVLMRANQCQMRKHFGRQIVIFYHHQVRLAYAGTMARALSLLVRFQLMMIT